MTFNNSMRLDDYTDNKCRGLVNVNIETTTIIQFEVCTEIICMKYNEIIS